MKRVLLPTLALLLLAGCKSIHEFPDCDEPSIVDVTLDIAINMNFEGESSLHNHAAYVSMLEDGYDMRYTVEIYKANSNANADLTDLVTKIVRTDNSLITNGLYRIAENLELPAVDYVALAWVDFVRKSESGDLYYKTDKLTSVSFLDAESSGKGYDITKDAFCGSVEVGLAQYCGQPDAHHAVSCPVRRPFAMYRVITTDIQDYFTYNNLPYNSIRPATTHVDYQSFFPKGYNVQFEEPGGFATAEGYDFTIADTAAEQEAVIASDFVLVSDESFYFTDLRVRNAEGGLISIIENLKITLKRNTITTIRDNFLTEDHSGGIGIDERFGEEIIIKI